MVREELSSVPCLLKTLSFHPSLFYTEGIFHITESRNSLLRLYLKIVLSQDGIERGLTDTRTAPLRCFFTLLLKKELFLRYHAESSQKSKRVWVFSPDLESPGCN